MCESFLKRENNFVQHFLVLISFKSLKLTGFWSNKISTKLKINQKSLNCRKQKVSRLVEIFFNGLCLDYGYIINDFSLNFDTILI